MTLVLKQGLLLFATLFAMGTPNYMNITDQGKTGIATEVNDSNPLLAKWDGPYNGIPPFDKVKISDFKPAIEAAMAEGLQEINKIASNPAAPNFENTIGDLERAGKTLSRVLTIYYIWSGSMNTPEFEPIETEMSPKISAYSDQIYQNSQLFKRIEAIHNSSSRKELTREQQRVTWRYYMDFVQAGAKLDAVAKKRVAQINQTLAVKFTKFSQNLLADEGKFLELKSEAELDGLTQSQKDAAAAVAASKKKTGSWLITNTRSSIDPFLTYSNRRDLREKAWRLFINRGDNGDAHDNNALITEILQLRAERAKLMGYASHAHWRMENTMAGTPERAIELMESVWKPAVARVHEEVKDMQQLADRENANIKIEPWDYRYYMEKVRKARYDLDQNEVKQYMQLEKLREGMFWMAGELFNFNFTQVTDVPVFHADVRVWKVEDKNTGNFVGLWYFDPYARPGKRSGAWMDAYRSQEKMDGVIPTIVSNNSNFIKGKPGEPVLISWDDASTLFHEFGHALHGLSSNVTYPLLSGTSVPRDYVEFPSQILERWLSTPEILNTFALHYQTGKPIPKTLVDRIEKAGTFNQGFATLEYLSSALVDMKLHTTTASKIDPDAFEKKTLAELGMPAELVMRHRTPQFQHIFSSDSYSAGYYSYLWSDVMSADAYEVFTKGKGAYDKEVAARLVKYIFSVGNTIDQSEAYKLFSGHDPNSDALMKHRGFPVKR